MGKVIQFPKMKRESVPISEEERLANIKRYQAELSLSTSIELTYHLFEEIESRGIKLRDKQLDQDLLMVCEFYHQLQVLHSLMVISYLPHYEHCSCLTMYI